MFDYTVETSKSSFDLLDGVEEMVSELPTDRDILVVCAKEGSSIMVAGNYTNSSASAKAAFRIWQYLTAKPLLSMQHA